MIIDIDKPITYGIDYGGKDYSTLVTFQNKNGLFILHDIKILKSRKKSKGFRKYIRRKKANAKPKS